MFVGTEMQCVCLFEILYLLERGQYSIQSCVPVQYSTTQYNTVQYCVVLYSSVLHITVLCSTVHYSTTQYSTV